MKVADFYVAQKETVLGRFENNLHNNCVDETQNGLLPF
jgi:hypothetical protein